MGSELKADGADAIKYVDVCGGTSNCGCDGNSGCGAGPPSAGETVRFRYCLLVGNTLLTDADKVEMWVESPTYGKKKYQCMLEAEPHCVYATVSLCTRETVSIWLDVTKGTTSVTTIKQSVEIA